MNFEVLVHGVPYGQDYWGPDSDYDRGYASLFYNSSEDGLQYIVETRKADGKNYCYYTYARYGNVLDCEGRGGSYVAVTYRFDMLYTDVKRIYQVLEIIFEKDVVGAIVERSEANFRFLCRSLKEKEDVMKKIEDDTLKLLQLSVLNDKLLPIDDIFIHQNAGRATCNIADCSENIIFNALKQVSRVVASPNSPDARDKKIAELQGSLATEKAQHQKDNEVWRGKLEGIKTDDILIAENQNLSNELFQSKKNYEGLESRFIKLSKKWSTALCILVPLLVLSLGGLAYLRYIAPQQPISTHDGYVSKLEYDKLLKENSKLKGMLEENDNSGLLVEYKTENSSLKEENETLKQKIAELKQQQEAISQNETGGDDLVSKSEEVGNYPNIKKLSIDFTDSHQPFKVGKEYIVTVICEDKEYQTTKTVDGKQVDGVYNGEGVWSVSEGFEMKKTDTPAIVKITITPLDSGGDREIAFTLPNNEKVVRKNTKLQCTQ